MLVLSRNRRRLTVGSGKVGLPDCLPNQNSEEFKFTAAFICIHVCEAVVRACRLGGRHALHTGCIGNRGMLPNDCFSSVCMVDSFKSG